MIVCSRCSHKRLWKLRNGKYRCAACKTSFRPRFAGICISLQTLKRVISEFILEHSTNIILERCPVSKYKLLKVLTALRTAMTKDVPDIFEGIVEVDETYLGVQWKNKPLNVRRLSKQSKRGRGTMKQPVFGILWRNGEVWAELVYGVEAQNLQPIIQRQVKKGSTVCSDT